ncbi:hypothetical protein [Legionella sp. km772]|uniref:hypothetical protein n=1 Tax=Legionella sp. km772 TaxID=2498111 RepID=UPI000F8C41B5|nr:hypothetical protein [Legionella sp. km772]RUR08651.1 hypothetical protein ELY15_10430 [Legionella sp. km772]
MKKIAFVSLMSTLSLTTAVNAGAMGDSGCAPSAFASVEGGYTYNKINGFEFVTGTGTSATTRSISAEKQQNQYTARLAAGLINMIDDSFGVTGELGWGYYGRTTFNLPVLSLGAPFNATSKFTLSGFDALIGAAWVQTYYSLSFKVGGLIQNMQISNTASLADVVAPAFGVYTLNEKHNSTAVLPAIKLGAAYNIDSNWAITGSWLFAFGASTGTTFTYTPAAVTNVALDINTQNPMTNSFMLGIQYSA